MLFIALLAACSANSPQSSEQVKVSSEEQPVLESKTIVAILKHIPSEDGTHAGMTANLLGKLVIVDNCLLIEAGDPNTPHYYQPIFFDNEYAWNEQKKVLIHKNENNKEYLVGGEIAIGGGGFNDTKDDEFRKHFNIPKCSVKATLWYT